MGGKITLKYLQSSLMHFSRQLNWAWMISFVLLTACLAFYITVVKPARQELKEVRAHLSILKNDEKQLVQTLQVEAGKAPAGQLDAFYQSFPSEDAVPDALAELIDIAKAQGLNPKQAEYRIIRNHPGELLSYQITLPIQGGYTKIIAFTFEMLGKIPNLSLDNISFHRQKIGDNQVEAMLWMTLYIKRGRAVEH